MLEKEEQRKREKREMRRREYDKQWKEEE